MAPSTQSKIYLFQAFELYSLYIIKYNFVLRVSTLSLFGKVSKFKNALLDAG